jgi:hypothetical protein
MYCLPVWTRLPTGRKTRGLPRSAGVVPPHQNGTPAASLVTGFWRPAGTSALG